MIQWLANPWIVAFLAPMIASALTIFIKWSSRNDVHASFKKEDCAIGLELSVAGIFSLLSAVPTLASVNQAGSGVTQTEIVALTLLIALCFTLGLWVVSTIVRKIGWESESSLRLWTGLVVPLVYGFCVLFITSAWISSNVGKP